MTRPQPRAGRGPGGGNSAQARRRRVRTPGRACIALIALMLWQHQRVAAQRARDGEFVAAARVGVAALLTIDHSHARDDVQRVLDLSTGAFRDDFQSRADDFIKTSGCRMP